MSSQWLLRACIPLGEKKVEEKRNVLAQIEAGTFESVGLDGASLM
jgi:hypothetical protein